MRCHWTIGPYQIVWCGLQREQAPLHFEKLSGVIYEWRRVFGPIDLRKWASPPPLDRISEAEFERALEQVRADVSEKESGTGLS
jgi:hypothetical protein